MFTGMGLAKQFINNRLIRQRGAATIAGSAAGAAFGAMNADRGEGWSGAMMGAGMGAAAGRYGGRAIRSGMMNYSQDMRRGAPGGAAAISAFLGASRSALNQVRRDGRSLISEGRRSMEYIGKSHIKSNRGNAMPPMLNHPQQSPMVGAGRSFSQDDRGVTMVNQALMDRIQTTRGYQNPGIGKVRRMGNVGNSGKARDYGTYQGLVGKGQRSRYR